MESSKVKNKGSECRLDLAESLCMKGGREEAKLDSKGRHYMEETFFKVKEA